MSLEDRIKRLEASAGQVRQESEADARRRRIFDRLYHVMENGRRELRGLDPLPTPPDLRETKEDHYHTLRVLIPGLRDGPGWKSDEAQEILRCWEDEALDQLSELDHEGDEQ